MTWLSVAWDWYSTEVIVNGVIAYPHASLVNPVAAGIGAALLVGAAIQQARIATQRHVAQTAADRERRITESFTKATEQLGSDKLEVRLGGIYTLERISRESRSDYWTVMETLTAFVRERSPWREPDAGDVENTAPYYKGGEHLGSPPRTDIAAVLAIVVRRPEAERKREQYEDRRLDLKWTELRRANLEGAYLEGANFRGANLEGVDLGSSHLEGANLRGVHLERANLGDAHFERADLWGANLEGANLVGTHFEGANLESAFIAGAPEVSHKYLASAFGDPATRLPANVPRPSKWCSADSTKSGTRPARNRGVTSHEEH